jgi:hypothetical protein
VGAEGHRRGHGLMEEDDAVCRHAPASTPGGQHTWKPHAVRSSAPRRERDPQRRTWQTVNDIDHLSMQLFPYCASQLEEGQQAFFETMQASMKVTLAQHLRHRVASAVYFNHTRSGSRVLARCRDGLLDSWMCGIGSMQSSPFISIRMGALACGARQSRRIPLHATVRHNCR